MKKVSEFFISFLVSLWIVALGQPARIGWLGALAAACGYALFFFAQPRSLTRSQKFAVATCWFASVQLIQLSWMTSIEYQGYYILVLYLLLAAWLGAQFGLLAMFTPAQGNIPLQQLLFCASLWTLMEWARLQILCGFSWNPIGLALTHFTPSLQFSSVFGVLGLSFWVILTNLVGLNALRAKTFSKASSWCAIAAFPYFFGLAQLSWFQEGPTREPLRISLVQTNFLPSEKMLLSKRADEFISPFGQWERIVNLLADAGGAKRDLIVLPEAAVSMPSDLCCYPYADVRAVLTQTFGRESEKSFPPLTFPFAEEREHRGQKKWCVSNLFWCQALASLHNSELVAGLDHSDRIGRKNFNSVFYFQPNQQTVGRYDKQILLPLAEFLPWDCLRSLSKCYGIHDFYSPGEGAKTFGSKIFFSPSICYEETFSEPMREGKIKGAELFVNVTNDNYFPESSLHEQHLFHSRVRAVENGVPLIRACNSGVTAVIDCFGRIQARFVAKNKLLNEGSLDYSFTPHHFPTLFSFWGEGGVICLCFIFFLYRFRI